jgi:hypothetical protein
MDQSRGPSPAPADVRPGCGRTAVVPAAPGVGGPPAGPRFRRHLAEQPRPAAAVDPFAFGSDAVPVVGPVFDAGYDSECAAYDCEYGGDIEEGDRIQADGEGGFVHEECARA